MKFSHYVLSWAALTIAFPSISTATPDPSPNPDAEIVFLRTNCDITTSTGSAPMKNCFEKMPKIKNWIFGATTNPRTDPTSPLLIDIGPGNFTPFVCISDPQSVDVEFRGSGVDKTNILRVVIDQCHAIKLSFSDLTMGSLAAFSSPGVIWLGGGNSHWVNTTIQSSREAWYDKKDASSSDSAMCQAGDDVGTHRFFSSRIIRRGNYLEDINNTAAFLSWCGDNSFWGSEILAEGDTSAATVRAISLRGPRSQLHLYGSNIRAESGTSLESTGDITAIHATDHAKAHVHGTGIDTIGKSGWTITALQADAGGHIHANESSYVMQPQSGATLRRIVDPDGNVSAPFQWKQGTAPPSIESVNGADTMIVTGTADNHPHMLVYDNNCSSTWYDMTLSKCFP